MPDMSQLPVEIVRSRRRKRTAQAYEADGRLRVLVPAGMSQEDEASIVATLVGRMSRKLSTREVDLGTRARELADRYGLPAPEIIEWSDRQQVRWGSCASDGQIRISSRLAAMPGWVLDWVVIHELAHLQVPNHGPQFQELVGRYELGERAEGYLIAKSETGGGLS